MLTYTDAFGQKSMVIGTHVTNKPNAILVLNPPDADQGFLLPQLTTANRLAIIPTSPAEDGLVVFDITEKSFYYWKEGAWTKGLGSGNDQTLLFDPATQTLTLSDGNTVSLSSLKELPDQTGQSGKFLTTDGVTLSWITVGSLGDITGVIAGEGLEGGAASGEATISIANDGVTAAKLRDDPSIDTNRAVTSNHIRNGAVTDEKILAVAPSKLTSGGASIGQILNWSGAAWIPQNDNTGTVTSILAGTGLTGGTITSSGTIGLTNTGVAASSYGSGTQIPILAIDAQGRITNAGSVPITGAAPTGVAGGDLDGTYPNPSVRNNAITNAKIENNAVTSDKIADGTIQTVDLANDAITSTKIADGTIGAVDLATNSVTDIKIANVAPSKLSASGASTGQVLKWNGTNWVPQSDNTGTGTLTSITAGVGLNGGTITTTGTIGIADDGVTTVKIANNNVTTAKLADGAVTNVKITDVAPSKITAGGATTGQVLKYNGANWIPQNDVAGVGTVTSIATNEGLTGGTIIGAGTIGIGNDGVTTVKIANSNVTTAKLADGAVTNIKITDVAPSKITAGGASAGQVLKYNGANWIPQNDAAGVGTVTSIATNEGLTGGTIIGAGTIGIGNAGVTTVKIANNNVTTAKLADGAVTNIKISDVAPSKITPGGASAGQVLKYNGANWIPQNDVAGAGTVTSISTGAGLTGGPITASGTVSIADAGVTTVKIADSNVTTAKLADGAVTTLKIADDAVTPSKILQSGTNGQVLTTVAGATAWAFPPLAGDVTGTLATTTVTKLQGRAVSTTAPITNQILQFDGAAWRPVTVPVLGIQTSYYTVDPSDFQMLKSNGKADKHGMAIFETDNTFVTAAKDDEGENIMSSIHIPHGATLTQMNIYYWDAAPENLTVSLLRKNLVSGTNTVMNTWASSGSSGSIRIQTLSAFGGMEVIANDIYSYRILVNFDINGSADNPGQARQRIYAIRITYTK